MLDVKRGPFLSTHMAHNTLPMGEEAPSATGRAPFPGTEVGALLTTGRAVVGQLPGGSVNVGLDL